MSRLTRDGTPEPVPRDPIFRCERGQGNIIFPCSADHVEDWQPYPVDPYSYYMCDHAYIHSPIFHFSTQGSQIAPNSDTQVKETQLSRSTIIRNNIVASCFLYPRSTENTFFLLEASIIFPSSNIFLILSRQCTCFVYCCTFSAEWL